jgi:hypothetical protein
MYQELLEGLWGRTIYQKWSQCMGRLVRYNPITETVTVCSEIHARVYEVWHNNQDAGLLFLGR